MAGLIKTFHFLHQSRSVYEETAHLSRVLSESIGQTDEDLLGAGHRHIDALVDKIFTSNEEIEGLLEEEIQDSVKKARTLHYYKVTFRREFPREPARCICLDYPTGIYNVGRMEIDHEVAIECYRGSQKSGSGSINLKGAQQLRLGVASRLPAGASFLPFDGEAQTCLKGGTCSSMTLSFLARYICLSRTITETPENILKMLMKTHEVSGEVFRTIQAVMNQVELAESLMNEEEKQLAKVQTLSQFFRLESEAVTPFFRFTDEFPASVFDSLEKGVYFIRMLSLSSQPPKYENYGHSLSVIHTGETFYHYEPNAGVLRPVGASSKLMRASLLSCESNFGLDGYRIYRLTPAADFFSSVKQIDHHLGFLRAETLEEESKCSSDL